MPDPKARFGKAKPGLHAVPPVALFLLGEAAKTGADKYGLMNWREGEVCASTYYNAAMRHLAKWWDGEDLDDESGLPHLAHVMASMAILLDAAECRTLEDDRPASGTFPRWVANNTKPIEDERKDK